MRGRILLGAFIAVAAVAAAVFGAAMAGANAAYDVLRGMP